jgi:hypothetical protein
MIRENGHERKEVKNLDEDRANLFLRINMTYTHLRKSKKYPQ